MSKYNCPYHGTPLRESKMTPDVHVCEACKNEGQRDGIFDGSDLKAGRIQPQAQAPNNPPQDASRDREDIPPVLPQGLPMNNQPQTPPPVPQRNGGQGQRRVYLLNNPNVHAPAVLRAYRAVFGQNLSDAEIKVKIMEVHVQGYAEIGTANSDAEVEQMKRDFQDVLRNEGYDYDLIEDEHNLNTNTTQAQDPWDLTQPAPAGYHDDDDDLDLDLDDDDEDDFN